MTERKSKELATLVGRDVRLEGLLRATSPARIEGSFRGEVKSDSTVVVGPDGRIDGILQARELVVMGRASGEFRVNGMVTVKQGGILKGTVSCTSLAVDEGGEARCEVNIPLEGQSGR